MKIKEEQLIIEVKLPGDENWETITIRLDYLKKQDFTCDESVSMDIMEYVYAHDERFYEQEEDLQFNVENYWEDIVVPTHKYIYSK